MATKLAKLNVQAWAMDEDGNRVLVAETSDPDLWLTAVKVATKEPRGAGVMDSHVRSGCPDRRAEQ